MKNGEVHYHGVSLQELEEFNPTLAQYAASTWVEHGRRLTQLQEQTRESSEIQPQNSHVLSSIVRWFGNLYDTVLKVTGAISSTEDPHRS